MTTVGHSLMGMSIGVLCVPARWGVWSKVGLLAAFAALGNAPDIANSLTPSGWYGLCHSIFVNGAAMIALGLIAWLLLARRPGWRRVIIGGQAAWASHLLLDATYSHGRGVHIFRPFSSAALVLTVPWFSTLKLPWSDHTAENLKTFAIEGMFYGGILLACVCVRIARKRRLDKAA